MGIIEILLIFNYVYLIEDEKDKELKTKQWKHPFFSFFFPHFHLNQRKNSYMFPVNVSSLSQGSGPHKCGVHSLVSER